MAVTSAGWSESTSGLVWRAAGTGGVASAVVGGFGAAVERTAGLRVCRGCEGGRVDSLGRRWASVLSLYESVWKMLLTRVVGKTQAKSRLLLYSSTVSFAFLRLLAGSHESSWGE